MSPWSEPALSVALTQWRRLLGHGNTPVLLDCTERAILTDRTTAHDRRHDDPQHVAIHPERFTLQPWRTSASSTDGSPDKLTFEDVRDYRLHLISRGLKPNSINPIMGALRFFYRTTLGLKEVSEHIPYARRADPLPAVLAREEVERFLKAVTDLKMRRAFITIYAAGLRVSEAVKLTGRDIDRARMVIIIRQSKGRKDRFVMLSEQLLGILRAYWKRAHLEHWLFPGRDPSRPITTRALDCTRAVLAIDGGSVFSIFGSPDDKKFRSSMTLFALAAGEGADYFKQAIERYCDGRYLSQATIAVVFPRARQSAALTKQVFDIQVHQNIGAPTQAAG